MAWYRGPTTSTDEGDALLRVGPVVAWLGLWIALIRWHVDDAGITYSYARSLGAGLGFRAHAEAALTEGFSNPLWTLLLAACSALGVAPHVASKLLQAAAGAATLLLVNRTVRHVGGERAESSAAALATAVCAPWAIWTAGGLETASLSLCLVGYLWAVSTARSGLVAGAFAAGVALSRPEGPVLTVALLVAGRLLAPQGRQRGGWTAATVALGAVLAWLAVRGLVFDAWLPTAAYTKINGSLPSRLVRGGLYSAVFAAEVGLPLLVLGWSAAWSSRRLSPLARATALVVAADFAIVWIVGGDWMRHGRLLAHLVPLIAMGSVPGLLVLVLRPSELGRPLLGGWARHLSWVFVAVWVAIQLLFWQDALRRPPLPMDVAAETVDLMADLGPALCDEITPRFAAPDTGAALYRHPEAVVIDLGGLTDARDTHRGPDAWPQRLLETRPQLVLVHGTWVPRTGLDDGALYSAGYRILCRREGTPGPSEDRFPPSLYRRADCVGDPGPERLGRLDAWCSRFR